MALALPLAGLTAWRALFTRAQLKGIVGLEIDIERLEGKWKVSQNRSTADREGVAAGLARHEAAHPMAPLVQGHGR